MSSSFRMASLRLVLTGCLSPLQKGALSESQAGVFESKTPASTGVLQGMGTAIHESTEEKRVAAATRRLDTCVYLIFDNRPKPAVFVNHRMSTCPARRILRLRNGMPHYGQCQIRLNSALENA